MRSYPAVGRGAVPVAMALVAALLAGCVQTAGTSDAPAAAAAPAPDFVTHAEQFAALQRAGLSGNYAAFVGHLKADDPAAVQAALQRNFRGKPFDVYTRKAKAGATQHQRMVELRSTDGRLYLYVQLDKVPGGWKVADVAFSRKDGVISAKL